MIKSPPENFKTQHLTITHVSSPEAYGNCAGTVTEDTPDNPSTPYAASKSAADMLLQVYQKQYGFPLVSVRATNVYGARQQLFKIIPRTVIYLKLGRKIHLHGGGYAVKSYIHIRDVSKGQLAILLRGRVGERYHISPDEGVSVREVVSRLAGEMGKTLAEATEHVADRPGQDAAYVIDSAKARQELDWKTECTLEDGLAEVVGWIENNWRTIGKTESGVCSQGINGPPARLEYPCLLLQHRWTTSTHRGKSGLDGNSMFQFFHGMDRPWKRIFHGNLNAKSGSNSPRLAAKKGNLFLD